MRRPALFLGGDTTGCWGGGLVSYSLDTSDPARPPARFRGWVGPAQVLSAYPGAVPALPHTPTWFWRGRSWLLAGPCHRSPPHSGLPGDHLFSGKDCRRRGFCALPWSCLFSQVVGEKTACDFSSFPVHIPCGVSVGVRREAGFGVAQDAG